MSANLLRHFSNRIPLSLIRFFANLYPPFLGAGIQIRSVSPDYRKIDVRLKRGWLNQNYVGTQFGGSIYAMTDPFFMLMLIQNLGRNYIVWDKAAEVRFRKPGTTALHAHFELSEKEIDDIRLKLATEEKLDWQKDVQVLDENGQLIAEVKKTIYIKKKTSGPK